jgi:hypothetical protein
MNYMRKEKTNEYMAGRTTKYSIPDAMGKGMYTVMTTTRRVASTSTEPANPDDDEWAGLDDEMEFDFDDRDASDGDLDKLWD